MRRLVTVNVIDTKLFTTPLCRSTDCAFNRDCANHATAGDFRSESGFTPNLYRNRPFDNDSWTCDQKETDESGLKFFNKQTGKMERHSAF